MPEFEFGRRIAEPLAKGCEILTGEIVQVGAPKTTDVDKDLTLYPLEFKVAKGLANSAARQDEVIQLVGARCARKKSPEPLWRVWSPVPLEKLAKGQKLLIVRWSQKDMPGDYLGISQPLALVLAEESDFDRVAQIVAWNQKHHGSARDLARALAALAGNVDLRSPLFRGYVTGFLLAHQPREAAENIDLFSGLVTLLNHEQMLEPKQANERILIAGAITSQFAYLPNDLRKVALKELIKTASNDGMVAQNAIWRLGELCKSHDINLQPFLNPELRKKLIATYEASVTPRPGGLNGFPPSPVLEKQLRN